MCRHRVGCVGVVGMTEKERFTVSVEHDIVEGLDQRKNLNRSGLVEDLLQNYLQVGDSYEASLQRQLSDKEEELRAKKLEKTRIENDISQLEREIDRIEQKIEDRRNSGPEEVEEFVRKFGGEEYTGPDLQPDNAAVETWARKAGVEPSHFIDLVEDRL